MSHGVFNMACEDEDLITEEEIKMLWQFATEYETYKISAREVQFRDSTHINELTNSFPEVAVFSNIKAALSLRSTMFLLCFFVDTSCVGKEKPFKKLMPHLYDMNK